MTRNKIVELLLTLSNWDALDLTESQIACREAAAILGVGAMACPDCHGSGWLADHWPGMFIPPEHVQCKRCDGTGGILVYEPEGVKP